MLSALTVLDFHIDSLTCIVECDPRNSVGTLEDQAAPIAPAKHQDMLTDMGYEVEAILERAAYDIYPDSY